MSTSVNHSALVSSMDTLDPNNIHHHLQQYERDERLRGTWTEPQSQKQIANNNNDTNPTTDTSSKDFKTGRLRSLYRTSYGLMFYSSIFILITSLLSASKGEDCTPIFEGNEIRDMSRGLDETQTNRVREVRVIEGSSFNLSCTLPRSYSFKWRLNNSHDLSSIERHFKIRDTIPSQGIQKSVLYAKDIHRNHSGDYTCIVSGCFSSTRSHHGLKIRVLFAEKPKITHRGHEFPELQIGLHNDVSIFCESNSTSPDIKWQKLMPNHTWVDVTTYCSEKNITRISKSSCYVLPQTIENTKILQLTINDITNEDYGEYSCGLPVSDLSDQRRKFNEVINIRAPDRWNSDNSRRKRAVHVPVTAAFGKSKYEGINYNKNFSDGIYDIVKVLKKFEKGTNSTIVVEGNPAELSCILHRDKEPYKDPRYNKYKVAWRIEGTYKKPDLTMKTIDGYPDFEYSENATFTNITIKSTNSSHAGWYQCVLYDSQECPDDKSECIATKIAASFEIQLRVKEKILPLYPFITICVEVLIISAIILIYEKSKSAAEVEESDTDGSPDQKVSDNNIEAEGISESTRLAKEKE